MDNQRTIRVLIVALLWTLTWMAQPTPTSNAAQAATGTLPPAPPSPVAFFRVLLELDEEERARALASRSEAQRESIESKLVEYAALAPRDRERRLQATELRWYLRPLLEVPTSSRAAHLVQVPEALRSLVKDRLALWDGLTPEARREFLGSGWALQYFLQLETATQHEQAALMRGLSPERRQQLEREFAHWQALPAAQRYRIAGRFQQFFELPPAEQEKTLDVLPEEERRQIATTLHAFARLAPAHRRACIEAFQKFAELTPAERAQFLRNADRWKEMSPADRAAWRRLVPQLPPSPPGLFTPPLPPMPEVDSSGIGPVGTR
jgi:hypothetical protein